MNFNSVFLVGLILVSLVGCKSTNIGGAVPVTTKTELQLDVLNTTWSDLILPPGDRIISDTGFVVVNWSNTSTEFDVLMGLSGLTGLVLTDLLRRKELPGNVEADLKESFDLVEILFNSLNSNQDLQEEIKSIHVNSNLKNQVITLNPYCIVLSGEKGITFIPQLKAIYRSESGKQLWQGIYGANKRIKPLQFDGSMTAEDVTSLNTRLIEAYGDMTNSLTANIQGRNTYISKEEDEKLTEDIINNLEINVSERVLNKDN